MNFSNNTILRLTLVFLFTASVMWIVNRHFINQTAGPYLFLLLGDTVEGQVKIYWNTGDGYSEQETSHKATHIYEQQLLKFDLPENLVGFRVDTDLKTDQILVLECKLGYYRWPFAYLVPSVSWTSGNQTRCIPSAEQPHQLTIQLAPDATDPFCFVQLPPPKEHQPWQNLFLYQIITQLITIVFCGLAVAISIFLRNGQAN